MNYSFIIPHKDSQEFLYKCIESIPIRDDIEIIVVDDNSDNKEFDEKYLKNHNAKLILSHESITAGGARNLGLKAANGKWILFADADDFYTEGFINELDKYVESENDIVYFDVEDKYHKYVNLDRIHQAILRHNEEDVFYLRYRVTNIWLKMFRLAFLKSWNIQFERAEVGNDVLFAMLTSYLAKQIVFLPCKLYAYTWHPNNTTYKKRTAEQNVRNYINLLKLNYFLKKINAKNFQRSLGKFILRIIKRDGLIQFVRFTFILLSKLKSIKHEEKEYIQILCTINPKLLLKFDIK